MVVSTFMERWKSNTCSGLPGMMQHSTSNDGSINFHGKVETTTALSLSQDPLMVWLSQQMIDTLTLVLISTYTVYILAAKHTKPVQLNYQGQNLFFLAVVIFSCWCQRMSKLSLSRQPSVKSTLETIDLLHCRSC